VQAHGTYGTRVKKVQMKADGRELPWPPGSQPTSPTDPSASPCKVHLLQFEPSCILSGWFGLVGVLIHGHAHVLCVYTQKPREMGAPSRTSLVSSYIEAIVMHKEPCNMSPSLFMSRAMMWAPPLACLEWMHTWQPLWCSLSAASLQKLSQPSVQRM